METIVIPNASWPFSPLLPTSLILKHFVDEIFPINIYCYACFENLWWWWKRLKSNLLIEPVVLSNNTAWLTCVWGLNFLSYYLRTVELPVLLTHHFAAEGPKPPHQANSHEQQQHQNSNDGRNPIRLKSAENKKIKQSAKLRVKPHGHYLKTTTKISG